MELATLTAGEGLDVTNGDGSITLSEDATASNKGIRSFSASYFSVSSGDVSIADATTSSKGIFHSTQIISHSLQVTLQLLLLMVEHFNNS